MIVEQILFKSNWANICSISSIINMKMNKSTTVPTERWVQIIPDRTVDFKKCTICQNHDAHRIALQNVSWKWFQIGTEKFLSTSSFICCHLQSRRWYTAPLDCDIILLSRKYGCEETDEGVFRNIVLEQSQLTNDYPRNQGFRREIMFVTAEGD